jgi:hypothetical protein
MGSQRAHKAKAAPDRDAHADAALGDLRFRALLHAHEWEALDETIRKRFSKRLAGGATTVYVGRAVETWMSRTGWLLAQAARLIGGPLPLARDEDVPSIVTVTEDMATGGQIWTRLYTRRNGFPQVIHSSKRFAGPTGLEEYVGFGICMALTVHGRGRALAFRSAGYFLNVFGRRLKLPRWVSPGELTVTHTDNGDGSFVFGLELRHPRLGTLIRQTALYREA